VRQLFFNTVHGLYKNLYAIRDSMTDVIVQDLVTDRKVKISCKDYVQKIAIYENRLAVQLSDKISIYEIFENRASVPSSATNNNNEEEEDEIMYQLSDRILKKLECNLLVVTSRNIILCQEMKLQLFSFKGEKIREWVMEGLIRYVRVVGGPPTREALLVGLQNGSILKIIIDNPFPIQLLKVGLGVKCLDISANRSKLAIVDEQNNCLVYDLKLKKSLYQEAGANSVAWNAEYEDMLCFSGNGILNIKTDNFPVAQHKFQGIVVGFRGSKIFALHMGAMTSMDIPQSASLYKYLERASAAASNSSSTQKEIMNEAFDKAYQIACLGVTDTDWRLLAHQALTGLNYSISKKSFIRLRDTKYISLLSKFEKLIHNKSANEQLFLAEIYAYQGKFDESAKMFVKAGQPELAMDMLCDLRKWKEAKELAAKINNVNLKDLIFKQASIAEEDKDLKAASELYIAAGEYSKAIHIMGEHQWLDSLIEVCRVLDTKTGTRAIATCAQYFRKFKHHDYAKEAYLKVGDYSSLIRLHVELQKWNEAFELLHDHPEFTAEVYLPYAQYLCTVDQFDEAQEAYKKAGHPKEALRMIQELGFNAVVEHRFRDAAYYLLEYAYEMLEMTRESEELTPEVREYFDAYTKFYQMAKMYYAYHFIHCYSELPFNSMEPKNLFNIARYLFMNTLTGETPYAISKVNITMALAKLGTILENYKLSRDAYQKLQHLRISRHLQDEVDLASITVNSKALTDNDELAPICYRCSTTNSFINQFGDYCQSCGHPFVRSFYSFEIIPLVEFELDESLSEEEALRLISLEPARGTSSNRKITKEDEWKETVTSAGESLSFDPLPPTPTTQKHDPFSNAIMNSKSAKLKVNATMLESFRKEDIFVVDWKIPLMKNKYYRNMVPTVPIVQCNHCHTFFHEEDFEFEVLKDGRCPFCRVVVSQAHV
jgi:intraflagellar transport protein 122